jgi:imidazolonepropionase-like amidohydrolase
VYRKVILRTVPLAALLAAALPPVPRAAPEEEAALFVRAGRLHHADGRTIPDAVVAIRGGRVLSAGSGGPVPAGARVLEATAAAPGFVDLWTTLPGGEEAEDPQPFAPGLRAIDGIDPADRAAAAAAREGVLRRLVLPSDRNPMGGRAAALRVVGPDGRLGADGPPGACVLSLGDAAARRDRYPGSLAGIVRGLESSLEGAAVPFGGADPELGLGSRARAMLAELLRPGARAFFHARSRGEVGAALRFAAGRKLRPVLVDPRCGGEALLDAAKAAGIPATDLAVVLALDAGDPRFHLEAAGVLARAGATVGFGSGGPARGPDAVRLAAALAVRHGMDPGAARAALLGRGFEWLGWGASGPAPGEPADLVLLDGDPVDPSSRIIAVLAGGEPLPRKGRP